MAGMLFAGWFGSRIGQHRLVAVGTLMLSWTSTT